MSELFNLGVCYYPDYLREGQLARTESGTYAELSIAARIDLDYRRMRRCGLELVRMGEFSWAQVEPEAGALDFSRFHLALDLAAEHGLKVIFCTPTATPPKWLCDAHPDILPKTRDGATIPFGGRRHYDPASVTYRRASRQITEHYAQTLGAHLAIIGWQTDNEFGHHGSWQSFSDECRRLFCTWLEPRYAGSIAALNKAWFTGFWSQGYSSFGEIDLPRAGWTSANPHLELEYRRFMTAVYCDFQAEQIKILRQYSPARFITHNLIPKMYDLCLWRLCSDLDIVGYDHYQVDALPDPASSSSQFNLMRSLKSDKPFLVLEQQPVQVNWQRVNRRMAYDWLFLWGAQAAFLGAQGMLYFSWQRFSGGSEQFHDGIVPHDLRIAESQQEKLLQAKTLYFTILGREFGLTSLPRPQADILIINSMESHWAHECPLQSELWQGAKQVDKIHQAFLALSMAIDMAESIAQAGPKLAQYRVIVLPGYAFGLSAAEREQLRQYVDSGGQVLSLPRTGHKDHMGQMLPFPYTLFDRDDFYFADYGALAAEEFETVMPLQQELMPLGGELWSEQIVVPAESPWQVQARFQGGFYADSPAAIQRRFPGGGSALHLAFWPRIDAALLSFLRVHLGLGRQTELPSTGEIQLVPLVLAGRRYLAALNFGETAAQLRIDAKAWPLARGLLAWIDQALQLQTRALKWPIGATAIQLELPRRSVFFGISQAGSSDL